jgi:hypothetical protein
LVRRSGIFGEFEKVLFRNTKTRDVDLAKEFSHGSTQIFTALEERHWHDEGYNLYYNDTDLRIEDKDDGWRRLDLPTKHTKDTKGFGDFLSAKFLSRVFVCFVGNIISSLFHTQIWPATALVRRLPGAHSCFIRVNLWPTCRSKSRYLDLALHHRR